MDYESIKKKYSGNITERRTAILLARLKVERLQARIEAAAQEREQYRQKDGEISAHNAQMWRDYTATLNNLSRQMEEAKTALAVAEIGTENLAAINAVLDNKA